MNRVDTFQLLNALDDRFILEAVRYAPEDASGSPERTKHMNVKRVVTLALAAVLILALGISAAAGYSKVSGRAAAEKVALEQIEVWKEMGLLSPDVHFEGNAYRVLEIDEETGSDYWYGRLFRHSYQVFWRGADVKGEGPEYGFVACVDTLSGKITWIDLNAYPDEKDAPTRDVEVPVPVDPDAPGKGMTAKIYHLYDNFDDILPADLTVDRFCSLLAEYWGFSGYRLADTVDTAYYNAHWEAIDGSTLMLDLPRSNPDNYYLTVFFDGDQEGVPMYIELTCFPGYVTLNVGTRHAVG